MSLSRDEDDQTHSVGMRESKASCHGGIKCPKQPRSARSHRVDSTVSRLSSMARNNTATKAANGPQEDSGDDRQAAKAEKVAAPRKPRAPTARDAVREKGAAKKVPKAQPDYESDDIIELSSIATDSTTDEDEDKKARTTVKGVEKMIKKVAKRVDRHARWCPFIHRSKQLRSLHRHVQELENLRPFATVRPDVRSDDEDGGGAKVKKQGNKGDKLSKPAQNRTTSRHQVEGDHADAYADADADVEQAQEGDVPDGSKSGQQRPVDEEDAGDRDVVEGRVGSGSDLGVSSPPDDTDAALTAAYEADIERSGQVKAAVASSARKAGGAGRGKRKTEDSKTLEGAETHGEVKKARKKV